MIGLCDNCALKYADCKGDKSLEKTRCDYYKKPVVMNVKELAERVAELEIENERLRRITEAPTADVVEVVRCGECKYMQTDGKCDAFADFSIRPSVSDYCSYGTLKGGEE